MTEDTIEEKVVERAQQKLKLDAMVVQRGMLQGEKKLEKDEMLAAIRCCCCCCCCWHLCLVGLVICCRKCTPERPERHDDVFSWFLHV